MSDDKMRRLERAATLGDNDAAAMLARSIERVERDGPVITAEMLGESTGEEEQAEFLRAWHSLGLDIERTFRHPIVYHYMLHPNFSRHHVERVRHLRRLMEAPAVYNPLPRAGMSLGDIRNYLVERGLPKHADSILEAYYEWAEYRYSLGD